MTTSGMTAGGDAYTRAYSLTRTIMDCYKRMERDFRYTVGAKVLDAATELPYELQAAYDVRDPERKIGHLRTAARQLTRVRFFMRLLKDAGVVSENYYLNEIMERTASIDEQLAKWTNSVRKTLAGRKPNGAAGAGNNDDTPRGAGQMTLL